jgi:hypothetical protein
MHMDSLEEELRCDLDVDIDHGILAAYCSSGEKARVESALRRKVDEVMRVLTDQVEEEVYMGGTRVVVGQGYKVKEILFPQEFITVFIRSLHPSVTKRELNLHLERVLGLSTGVIRSLELFSYDTNQTAVIKFTSKAGAQAGLELLKRHAFRGRQLEIFRAGMGPKQGVSQEEVCRLKLSWALGQSEGKAQVSFHTPAEANTFIESVGLRFGGGVRVTVVHGETNYTGRRSNKKQHVSQKRQPPAVVLQGQLRGACRFRFAVGFGVDEDFDDYKVRKKQ